MPYLEIGFLPKLEFSCNEALNTLATNLSYCGKNIKTILVTSRYAYEGKSFMSINLVRTLASLRKRVVLVDADLRRSHIISQHQLRFSSGQHYGLAHYLAGMCEMDDVVYQTNIPNSFMVPIGREVGSSLQLLSSERMALLLDSLREHFDVVIVDAPPAGVIVDAVEIAKHCDGALIVVSYNRGRKRDITEVVNVIQKTGCPVLGAVLNNVDFRAFTSKNYYYKSERYATYYKRGYMTKAEEKAQRRKRKSRE